MPSAFSPVLLYSILVNAVVGLTMGAALLLVWRGHRSQLFTRDLGVAQLAQALVPMGYLMSQWVGDEWTVPGMVLAVFGQIGSIALMLSGSRRLSGWVFSTLEWVVFSGLLLLAGLWAVLFSDPSITVWVSPSLMILAGVVVTRGLRGGLFTDRLVGPLMVLLGLNQLCFAFWGQAGLLFQSNAGAVLRLLLGLTLVYATLDRSMLESDNLRKRFQQLVERSHQGILVLVEQRVRYANSALLGLYGFGRREQVTLSDLLQGVRREEVAQLQLRYQQIESGTVDELQWEGLRHRKDGSSVWLRFSGWRTQWGDAQAIQILVTDQTDHHDVTQALLYQATHDELTGLPNRSALLQRLRQCCVVVPDRPSFGLVLLGVDRFKLFNEAHGHSLGDEVLKALAIAVERELGEDCELMRLGADEFAFLARPYHDRDSAAAMARRVQQLLLRPLVLPQRNFFIDVSMGIALYPKDAQDAESLLRAANAAMHAAKRTPGTSVALAEARFERGSSDVFEQEQALRAGIEQCEFSLYYQPKVDARTGQLASFEALARWHRPGVGWVSPVEFIAVAERTGLIADLGLLLLSLACEQVALWRQRFTKVVPVAVNVSPLQMLDGGFPELVEQLLLQHRLPAHAITLEITESAAVANLDQARKQIRQLRNLGIAVGLDDFGTGFSSLNMLRSLPLQSVKIDRGLIEPLPAADATAVVQAICQLAVALRLDVVAEGIETPAQANIARLAGCHELQGDLFAKPLTPEEAAQWLLNAPVAVFLEA
ncbi:bifunctional diguanylate cyclase/phosphodiesterase [Rhodoferax sp.]|uniref:putative bifunctional diguanylate cyclase/phosphodiesterase n=1 Tax=Rhodoferax sp. TaxID=50421 RepID=UPI0025D2DAB2|nr:bifunctional diguanylate cyclase/phosphodiesterase [Rhodoferax sp.]